MRISPATPPRHGPVARTLGAVAGTALAAWYAPTALLGGLEAAASPESGGALSYYLGMPLQGLAVGAWVGHAVAGVMGGIVGGALGAVAATASRVFLERGGGDHVYLDRLEDRVRELSRANVHGSRAFRAARGTVQGALAGLAVGCSEGYRLGRDLVEGAVTGAGEALFGS